MTVPDPQQYYSPFPSLQFPRPVQERVEESAEAAEERHPHEDDRCDGHQGQRVRGFLPQTRAAHGHFREGLGETLPHSGGQHPSGPGWQVRWCGHLDALPSMAGRNPPPSRRPAPQWPWLAGTLVWSFRCVTFYGWEKPSPIQEASIPVALAGRYVGVVILMCYPLWLGETLPHPGGQHPSGPGWKVRWCGYSDALPSMAGRNPPSSRRPASRWPWLAGTLGSLF
jgi:hypothetical protein